jgi:uncharacterized protein (DUF433 family)
MDVPERIFVDPEMIAPPCVKGANIPVHLLLEKMAAGETHEQLLAEYPELASEDLRDCLLCAAAWTAGTPWQPKRDPSRPPLPPIRRVEPTDRKQEMQWISEHRLEYKGEWVALAGDRLIAHGPDGDPVFAAARAEGVVPFLFRCPDDDLPTVGGL